MFSKFLSEDSKPINENDIFFLVARGARIVQSNYEKTAEFFNNSINYLSYVE